MSAPNVSKAETHKRCARCGKGRQKCVSCECYSLRGHVKGQGLCLYHWDVYAHGRTWADKVRGLQYTSAKREASK